MNHKSILLTLLFAALLLLSCEDEKQKESSLPEQAVETCDSSCEAFVHSVKGIDFQIGKVRVCASCGDAIDLQVSVIKTDTGIIAKCGYLKEKEAELSMDEWLDFIKKLYEHTSNYKWGVDIGYGNYWTLEISFLDSNFIKSGTNSGKSPENWKEFKKIMEDMDLNIRKKVWAKEEQQKLEKPIANVYDTDVYYYEKDRDEILKGNLIGLFYENDAYYLKPEKLVYTANENNCTGEPDLAFESKAKFLFLNFKNYNKNEIPAIRLPEGGIKMLPGGRFGFYFNDIKYEFEAFGKGKIDERSSIKNFYLDFSQEPLSPFGKRQTILKMPEIIDHAPKLLFIGDLDGDGIPDVILYSSKDYTSTQIRVYLSSTADGNNILRLEVIKDGGFAC